MYKPFERGSTVILQDDGNIGKKGSLAVKAYLPPRGKGHYYNLYFDFDTGVVYQQGELCQGKPGWMLQ